MKKDEEKSIYSNCAYLICFICCASLVSKLLLRYCISKLPYSIFNSSNSVCLLHQQVETNASWISIEHLVYFRVSKFFTYPVTLQCYFSNANQLLLVLQLQIYLHKLIYLTYTCYYASSAVMLVFLLHIRMLQTWMLLCWTCCYVQVTNSYTLTFGCYYVGLAVMLVLLFQIWMLQISILLCLIPLCIWTLLCCFCCYVGFTASDLDSSYLDVAILVLLVCWFFGYVHVGCCNVGFATSSS